MLVSIILEHEYYHKSIDREQQKHIHQDCWLDNPYSTRTKHHISYNKCSQYYGPSQKHFIALIDSEQLRKIGKYDIWRSKN